MLKNLKYEIKPYPKGKNKRYDASYKPTTQATLFQMNKDIKQELGFIYIVNGKKFLTKAEAVRHKKSLQKYWRIF